MPCPWRLAPRSTRDGRARLEYRAAVQPCCLLKFATADSTEVTIKSREPARQKTRSCAVKAQPQSSVKVKRSTSWTWTLAAVTECEASCSLELDTLDDQTNVFNIPQKVFNTSKLMHVPCPESRRLTRYANAYPLRTVRVTALLYPTPWYLKKIVKVF